MWAGLCGVVAFAVPLALFLAAAFPGVEFADPGEIQTVSYILGIAHPTGFPAFILLGWLFSHVLPFGDVAWRITLLCALSMATACVLLYASARELGSDVGSACGAALLFAAGSTAWTVASRTDILALLTLLSALLLWLAIRLRRTGRANLLVAIGLAGGVAVATHPLALLLLPGVFIVALWGSAGFHRREVAPAAAAFFVAGLALYAYLPIRSAIVSAQRIDPTLTLGFRPGMAFWDYNHTSSLAGFVREVSGSDFAASSTFGAFFTAAPYERLLQSYLPRLAEDFGVALLLALIGAVILVRRDPRVALGLGLTALVPTAFGLGYLGEQDYDRYYLPSFLILALLAGLGATALAERIFRTRRIRQAVSGPALLIAIAAFIAISHRAILLHHQDNRGEQFLTYIRAHTPAGAIVVAAWPYAAPLAYGAYVEHSLGGRTVVSGWPEEWEPAYLSWSRARPLYAVSNLPIHLRSSTTRLVDQGRGPILVQVDP